MENVRTENQKVREFLLEALRLAELAFDRAVALRRLAPLVRTRAPPDAPLLLLLLLVGVGVGARRSRSRAAVHTRLRLRVLLAGCRRLVSESGRVLRLAAIQRSVAPLLVVASLRIHAGEPLDGH